MITILDLSSELLIDRSHIRDPYVRLLLAALAKELARGSPWVTLDKAVASTYEALLPLLGIQRQPVAA